MGDCRCGDSQLPAGCGAGAGDSATDGVKRSKTSIPRRVAPFKYPGGKFRYASWLARVLEGVPHDVYCEPFGGAASVLLVKEPVPVEVYNDLDWLMTNFFYVISHPRLFKEFRRRVNVLPYSRPLFAMARKRLLKARGCVDRAVWWFVLRRQAYTTVLGKSWATSKTAVRFGMAAAVTEWMRAVDGLWEIAHRFARVLIDCRDGIECIGVYDSPETVFYCDPPYHPELRARDPIYLLDVSAEYHERLAEKLASINGMAVLSAYEHEAYRPLVESGYRVLRIRAKSHIPCGRFQPKKEDRIEAFYIHPRIAELAKERLSRLVDMLSRAGKLAGQPEV